jgi:hypothetical protein
MGGASNAYGQISRSSIGHPQANEKPVWATSAYKSGRQEISTIDHRLKKKTSSALLFV